MPEATEVQSPFLQENNSGERHPFQDLLFGLRKEGLRVSTDEWLDLQKVLEKGKIENLDEMYFVSRSVLVKDISDYASFDTVFGKLFFGIEPPKEDEEEPEDEFEEPEEKELEENQSQEVVEPGQTEEHHGGEDVHKAIEDSKSKGDEQKKEDQKSQMDQKSDRPKQQNEQKNEGERQKETGSGIDKDEIKKENLKAGKGGQSAKEIISERRHDVFDKDKALNYEQFGRVLAKLVTIIQDSTEEPTQKLDVKRTVSQVAKNAGAPELVWREEVEEKPKVLLFFDVGGSTEPYQEIMEKLFAAAEDYLENVEIYYFHNAIYGEVWPQKDGNFGKNFIPMEKILKNESTAKVIIVGDASMAENDMMNGGLYDSYNELYEVSKDGYYSRSGYENFKAMRNRFNNIVWVNPIKEKERDLWRESEPTIEDLERVFSTYELTLRGIEKATQELMES